MVEISERTRSEKCKQLKANYCLIKFDQKVNSKMNNQLNNQMLGKRIHLKIIIDAN